MLQGWTITLQVGLHRNESCMPPYFHVFLFRVATTKYLAKVITGSQLFIAMDDPIGDALVTDELLMDERTVDEPDAEGAAMDGPAKEEISVDEALHVSTGRRWSDAGSELTRPTTAAQVKARLNTNYPSQAILYSFVEYIEDLDAQLSLREQIREGRSKLSLEVTFELMFWMFVIYLASLIVFRFVKLMLAPFITLAVVCAFMAYASNHPDMKYYGDCPEDQNELGETPEIDRLRDLKALMVETLRHRQLEILCRYGDYLAERLGTLRQYIRENKLETEHKLSENWTETSAVLRGEERQESAPCHNLIRTAAQGLKWKQEATIFMVHEYAKRNNLMHAELFDLVDRQDWYAIEQRSKEDIEKLRELFINSDPDSKAAIEDWMQIIGEFRDRWVRQSEDGSAWEARSIIQEAIMAGVDDRASLNKLAMLPEDAAPTTRERAIKTIKKENALKEAQRNKTQQQADAALQAENRLLQAEVAKLENLLELRGASEDFLANFEDEVERNDELEKENKRCRNRIRQLEEQNAAGKTRERALKKELKNPGVAEQTDKNIERTSGDAEGKETNIEDRNTDTGEKDMNNGEKNMGVEKKDSKTEEKNTDTAEKSTTIEERGTNDRADSGAIE